MTALAPDLTIRDAAIVLATSAETVRRMVRSGAIAAYRTSGARSPLRITPAAIEDYRDRQKEPDPWVRTRAA
ncbi:MAG: helix-turn-helix domain-containing protein [Rhodoglobus sp.]